MKIKVEGFELKINLMDLVDAMTEDARNALARMVAADKQLLAGVLECVASQGTVGHYFNEPDEGEWWFDSASLLELREKLLPLMPEIARGAVKKALQQRNDAVLEKDRMWKWAFALYHAWPDRDWSSRPPLPRNLQHGADPTPA